jgi:cysteine-rich repeat protein
MQLLGYPHGRMFRRLALVLLALPSAACGETGAPPAIPEPSLCGNGVVQAGEECDDGNLDDADSCLRSCESPAQFVPSDPHIHGHGCSGDLGPDALQNISSARGVVVTTPLVWGDGYDDDRGFFTGRDDPASRAGALVHYELEVSHFPAAQTGHLLLYGLASIDFSPAPFRSPRSGMPVVDFARAQGPQVVVGMAHGQFWPVTGRFPELPETCCMPYDFATEALRGRVSFLGTEHRGSTPALDAATAFLHHKVLNAGGRVALVGASDFPCINRSATADTVRTDVLLDQPGELSYARWLEALGRGRTTLAVGGGTRLNLRVNGARLGDEVRVEAGATMRVTIEARMPAPAQLQVLANGVPVTTASLVPGAQAEQFKLRLERSAWLQAVTPWAATSPIYVLVEERPIRGAPEDICYLARYTDHLSDGVQRRRLDLGGETAGSLAAYAEVRSVLERRFSEAGGTLCP